MIGHLNDKIRRLIFSLLILIFVFVSGVINCCLYIANVGTLKKEFRELVIEVKLKNITDPVYVKQELSGFVFAAVKVQRKGEPDFEPKVCVNQIPGVMDEVLIQNALMIQAGNSKEDIRLPHLIYIIKRKNSVGKYIFFIPKSEAVKHFLPMMSVCLLIEAVILLLMFYVTVHISKLLVKPVEDMVQAEKKFISNASHELKTPLSVIVANADLLTDIVGNEKHLEYIKAEAMRMNQLIMQMLTLAKLDFVTEFYDRSVFSLDEAIMEVIYPFEGAAYEKSLTLTLNIQSNMRFNGDKQQIQKVISILIDNAIEYSNAAGTITVNAYRKTDSYLIEITNPGKEIPEYIQNIIFERFYRQDTIHSNDMHFGLGLSIAYEIINKHNGTIKVRSERGTNCFTVILPIKK